MFAPIDSVPAVAARVYPWAPVRLLASYEFDSFAKAATIDLPVVMFHGWPDSYMRQSDARILLEQFRGQKLMVKTGGGHHHAGFVDSAVLYRVLGDILAAQSRCHFADVGQTRTIPPAALC